MTKKPDPSDEELLLPAEVAEILRVPVATLNSWRARRRADLSYQGPKFLRIEGGRVRYRRGAVREYIAEREASAAESRTG